MSSVGSYLRELRERRGVSLDEIARETRVTRTSLQALEAGDLAALPPPVFTRGFIVAYCQALGEPPDEALARYAGPAPTRDAEPSPRSPAGSEQRAGDRSAARGRSPVLVSFVLLVVLGAALFAVAFFLQSTREPGLRRAESPSAEVRARRDTGRPVVAGPSVTAADDSSPAASTASSIVSASPPARTTSGSDREPSPRPTSAPPASPVTPHDTTAPRPSVASAVERPTAAPPAATAATTPSTAANPQEIVAALGTTAAPYRLVARTTAPTWIRVRTDDGRQSEETIPAGQVREWVSNRPFTVAIGNAGGVKLELNGRPLPLLGTSGAVIPRLVLPSEAP